MCATPGLDVLGIVPLDAFGLKLFDTVALVFLLGFVLAIAVHHEPVRPAVAYRIETPDGVAVVSGDTLGAIAKQYYGNAMKYPVIFDANKPMLSDPDKIYPGQVLRIPPIG